MRNNESALISSEPIFGRPRADDGFLKPLLRQDFQAVLSAHLGKSRESRNYGVVGLPDHPFEMRASGQSMVELALGAAASDVENSNLGAVDRCRLVADFFQLPVQP